MSDVSSTRRVFVISDLHLGGRPPSGGEPGFQMCPPRGQKRLASFIRWVAAQARDSNPKDRQVDLIVNGDIVDFLAEENLPGEPKKQGYPPFRVFTYEDHFASKKLERVITRTQDVWDAFAQATDAGVKVSFLLGNHDIELSLPGPQQILKQKLRSNFHFSPLEDAFQIGPVLIEHGNRYDHWNAVPTSSLEKVLKSIATDGSYHSKFKVPGSELVVKVMNKIKQKYDFVDLLKPEITAMLPMLAVLEPSAFQVESIIDAARVWRKTLLPRVVNKKKPSNSAKISNPEEVSLDKMDEEYIELANDLAEIHPEKISVISSIGAFIDIWSAVRAGKRHDQQEQLDRLRKALCAWKEGVDHVFDVSKETKAYSRQIKKLMKEGDRKIVVHGHTHLAKQVTVDGGVYLNTGTWADIIHFPQEALQENSSELEKIANDIAGKTFSKRRIQLSTFAEIEVGRDTCSGCVKVYKDGCEPVLLPIGQLTQELLDWIKE